jgi:hypothetical protein
MAEPKRAEKAEKKTEPKTEKKVGKKGKKKRAEPVYVPVQYPFWLGAVSFAWAVVGWLGAALAPRLAFVPGAGALHLLLPAVTAVLLAVNLMLAVRGLLRGAHVLRLAPVTGVQVALFTTLFFQLYAHGGAELYDAPGETGPWHWLQFSVAHALRAGDVFDAVEAYGWGVQSVKHTSPLVAVFVVAYHVVVDVFFLGLVWAAVGRLREAVLDDDELRGLLARLGLVAFAVWLVTWVIMAFIVRPWRAADVPLWFLENLVRVVDFADVMESFGVRFHTLPREGVVGTLTLFCRLWIAIGLAVLVTRKRKPPPRRVLTPPGVTPGPYWRVRGLALGGMAAGMVVVAVAGWVVAGRATEGLAAAVKEGPEGRSQSALRALRRMGPSAGAAVPELVAARPAVPPAVRDEITHTLGYLGAGAGPALRAIALTDPPESAAVAADALAAVGGPAAPDLVAVWEATPADTVRDRAEAGLKQVGGAAVGPLLDGFTRDNAHGHFVWLEKLDPNWRLRNTDNSVGGACQRLPDLIRRANGGDPADTAAALGEMRACGTASKAALDTLVDHLGHKDHAVQSAAAGLVTAIGPSVTPRLLTVVEDAGTDRFIPPGVMTVLREEAMWDAAALASPSALPALLTLARRGDGQGFPVVVRRVGHYGPAGKAAAPTLLPRVADPDGDTRAGVRAALDRIHPSWKADPALNAQLPTLLYQLPALPKAEADELCAVLGNIPETQSKSVRDAVDKKLREVNQNFRGSWDKTVLKQYEGALDEVFGPVERLGPKARALVPSLNAMLGNNRKELNDPKARVVAARLMRTLDAVDEPGGGDIAGRLSALGTGDEALAFLRSRGKAALPAVGELVDHRAPDQRLLGYHAAAALGPDAAELLPRLLAQVRNANVLARPRFEEAEVWMLGRLAPTLTAIDPNWWARPEAAVALAELVRVRDIPGGREEAEARQRVFGLMTAAGAAAAPAVPRVAAGMIKDGGLDRPARDVFDKLAPDWRDDPAVRREAAGLVAMLSGGIDWKTQQTLTILGGAAVPALVAGLETLPDPFLTAQPPYGSAVNVIERLQAVLTEIGPPATGATPALLKLTAKPEIHPAVATRVLDLLEKTDPGWTAAPAYKAAVGAAGEALLKRSATTPDCLPLAARCGASVGPELTRRLGAATGGVEKMRVLAWIGSAGKAAKTTAPAVARLAADKADPPIRLAAIDALGKVGAGDPTLASALTPGLLDTDPAVRSKTGLALDAVDPAWRTKPAAKSAAAEAVKGLTSPDARKRYDSVGTLDVVGPTDGAAVTALTQLVNRETDANTKQYAEQVLGRLRKKP